MHSALTPLSEWRLTQLPASSRDLAHEDGVGLLDPFFSPFFSPVRARAGWLAAGLLLSGRWEKTDEVPC